MNRIPIRIRLTLIFAVGMAIVLAAVGLFVYLRVASDLGNAFDKDLRSRGQALSALVESGGSVRATGTADTFAEVVAPGGRVVDATPDLGKHLLLSGTDLARATRGASFFDLSRIPGQDESGRMLALPLQGRVLVVGATLEHRNDTLTSLQAAFLIGGPVALLLMSIGGYLLAGAALRPIESMRRRAAEISASSLHERLPVSPSDDEVSRLGRTLNEMLARLEDGLERERRFLADASHELRTPLATLRAELELALRRSRTTQEFENSIRSAAEETDRLSRIADDLLILARAEQGTLALRPEPTDFLDVVEKVRDRFGARAELEGRSLTVEADDAPVARVDRLRVEQALGNMVDNAFEHGRGPITITAGRQNSSVELHVLDEGPGLAPEFREHAFEAFTRATPSGNGSGLGLAIVETIARAHDGSAGAKVRPEGGADVWIRLPL
ncbi:MAG TPA: ATP-binding protein [Gaiellaceae bacterium]|nr:ATP-binding protein [Gaiellaceae bacterium]